MMTNHNNILMKRSQFGLAPLAAQDDERVSDYALGSIVEVSISKPRSTPNHRHYWGVLHALIRAEAVPYQTAESLDGALKMACGIVELRKDLYGEPYTVPGSLSYAKADEAKFTEYKRRAFRLIAELYGINVDDITQA
jgi:hypothetical protein